MSAPVLPPGRKAWQVTSGPGTRWLRQRAGGPPVPVPDGAAAAEVTDAEVYQVVLTAPPRRGSNPGLAELWAMTEAAGPSWGWVIWRLGADPADPDGWTFIVDSPAGATQRYNWVRGGSGMTLAVQSETPGADREPIAG